MPKEEWGMRLDHVIVLVIGFALGVMWMVFSQPMCP